MPRSAWTPTTPCTAVARTPSNASPGSPTHRPPAAGTLPPAEGPADLGARGATIEVGDAAVAASGRQKGLRVSQAVGEQRRGRAVGGGILRADRLAERGDRNQVQNRREGLGLYDRPVVAGAHDRRLHEVAGPFEDVTAAEELAARGARGGERGPVGFDRVRIDQRAHERSGLERIADAHLPVGVYEAVHTVALPRMAARQAFQDHTATGKLRAEMTPTTPSGCHCSDMRCFGRSECMLSP